MRQTHAGRGKGSSARPYRVNRQLGVGFSGTMEAAWIRVCRTWRGVMGVGPSCVRQGDVARFAKPPYKPLQTATRDKAGP